MFLLKSFIAFTLPFRVVVFCEFKLFPYYSEAYSSGNQGLRQKRAIVTNLVLKSIRSDLTSTLSSFVTLCKMLKHSEHIIPGLFNKRYEMMVSKHSNLTCPKQKS